MNRCPKCGGMSGLYFKEWQLWYCDYTWDGEPDGGDSDISKGGAMMYCRDCHKPVIRATKFFEMKNRGDA